MPLPRPKQFSPCPEHIWVGRFLWWAALLHCGLLCLTFLALTSPSRADTTWVSGTVSGEWTSAGNPYIVTDIVRINANDSLIIGPGVQIIMQQRDVDQSLAWEIAGRLTTCGTEQDSITFSAMDTSHWWGLRFRGPFASCSVNYTVFEKTEAAVNMAYTSNDSQFRHCFFRDQYFMAQGRIGFGSQQDSLIISNCRFEQFFGPTVWGRFLIESSIFRGTWHGNEPGGSLVVDESNNGIIRDCLFENYSYVSLSINSNCRMIRVENCLFSSSDYYTYHIVVGDRIQSNRDIQILNNTFVGNNAVDVLFTRAGSNDLFTVHNNIFSDAAYSAILVAADFDPSRYHIGYNCFWNNTYNFQVEDSIFHWPSFGRLVRTNYRGDSTDMYWNLFREPLFDGTDAYGLSDASPCIDAGVPIADIPYSGNGPDMGYLEFGIEGTSRSRFILPPSSFSLSCFPNPFNPTTTISFTLPKAGYVDLNVYDVTGRLVRRLAGGHMGPPLQAGEHSFVFDGSDLPSGIYFVRVQAGDVAQTQKIVLLK